MHILQLSEKLILQLKMENPFQDIVDNLAELPVDSLRSLNDDNKKKAFWINLYNAYFLILRKHLQFQKSEIYTSKLITIASQKVSLDDIEHGILRRYRIKKSLGYLPNIFAPSWIKKLAVAKIDYRIHFALNCGAVSCPPIAFYNSERVEHQLEMATYSFLEGETKIDEENKIISISKLFLWYKGDFGGDSGIRKIIKQYLKIESKGYTLIYSPYNWEEDLFNFSEKTF